MRHQSTKWIFLPEISSFEKPQTIPLSNEKWHHLYKVLRVEPLQTVFVTNGLGLLFEGVLKEKVVELKKIIRKDLQPVELELVIGLPKNATMDSVIEKATECFVTKITPVITSRSVVKVDLFQKEKYLKRWTSILHSSVEQTETTWCPTLSAPLDFEKWLSNCANGTSTARLVFLSELRESKTTRQLIQNTWQVLKKYSERLRDVNATQHPEDLRDVNPTQYYNEQACCIFIGPEGGLSSQEIQKLTTQEFQRVSLGKHVLRVETAVVSALTLVNISRNLLLE